MTQQITDDEKLGIYIQEEVERYQKRSEERKKKIKEAIQQYHPSFLENL